jgi:hypothetical protein
MTTGADWVDQATRLVETFVAATAAPPSDGAAHSDTCRWCPVCQVVAVARGERPEVSAALADVLATTASVLRTFAEQGLPAESAPAAPEAAESDLADEADDGPVVQRIDIA